MGTLAQALITYRIRIADLHRHHFEVDCIVADPTGDDRFRLPSWIPGSYLMREYARHVVGVRAASNGRAIGVEKIDKSTWRCSGAHGELRFTVTVFALDESVRGAYLDARRAYFNGPCVFVAVIGREMEPVELVIEEPEDPNCESWKVATAMQVREVGSRGFGTYVTNDYDELLDHPVEISNFECVEFEAAGVPHRLVIAGRVETDLERIAADLRELCQTQIRFFGEPAPFDRYSFLALAVGNGYGGLEHRASSSLIFNRTDLPSVAETSRPANYLKFLALCSHEYFHTWHVKRTKPKAFIPYRLNERNYTRLLWVFEGITSYYQELMLLRAGLADPTAFLRRIGETLTRVYRSPGRHAQSIAEASFDAWDVLYKPEANSPNSSISYYSKGALVALALDLLLRRRSDGEVTLDTLVIELWTRFGAVGQGIEELGFEELAKEIGGPELGAFFDTAVHGTEDVPLAELLSELGVGIGFRPTENAHDKGGTPRRTRISNAWLGATWRPAGNGLELTHVLEGGPLQLAGAIPGDLLIAIDRLQISAANIETRLEKYRAGDSAQFCLFRGDELIELAGQMQACPDDTCFLHLVEAPAPDALKLRQAWLGA